jgi:hypothetical protein
LVTLLAGVSVPSLGRSLSDISRRWSCEFKNDPNSNRLRQGIECSTRNLCNSPAQDSPLTYTDLDDFTIDFEARTVSYVASTKWFPAVRERLREQLRREGKPDTTTRLEERNARSFALQSVSTSKALGPGIPEITTIVYMNEDDGVPVSLHIIGNGKRALIAFPGVFSDILFVVHYFGACNPAGT